MRRETTRPAREVLRELNDDVTRQTPSMSAAQNLALLQRILPGITAREVSDAFAVNFDPSRSLVLAELPASDGVPSEPELLALGRTAIDVKPDKLAEAPRATTLLATLPTAGTVVESVTHAASGVTSMWLDNGVRVHHRQMDQRRNEASVVYHAGRRHDRGDGGQPRDHRGGASSVGAPGHQHAVQHPDPRPDDRGQGAGAQPRGRRHADAHRLR